MKDFSPHAILRDPSISDETVERMIQDALSRRGGKGPVILIIDPALRQSPARKPWSVVR